MGTPVPSQVQPSAEYWTPVMLYASSLRAPTALSSLQHREEVVKMKKIKVCWKQMLPMNAAASIGQNMAAGCSTYQFDEVGSHTASHPLTFV